MSSFSKETSEAVARAGFLGTLFTLAVSANAAPIFQDNFESYAPGSNIIGQNNWTTGGGTQLIVRDTGLPSHLLLDGTNKSDNLSETQVLHSTTGMFSQGESIDLLTFTALAVTNSDNSYIGLVSPSQGRSIQWQYFSDGWHFDSHNGSNYSTFNTQIPANIAINFAIYFDSSSSTMWGSYNVGAGWVNTPSVAAPVSFSNLYVHMDQRLDRNGIQVDNILFAPVPEAPIWVLLPFGLGAVSAFTRRRLRRANREPAAA